MRFWLECIFVYTLEKYWKSYKNSGQGFSDVICSCENHSKFGTNLALSCSYRDVSNSQINKD